MGNAIPVIFDHARKLAAHGLSASGHIVSDYLTGFRTRGYHVGPKVTVTPFSRGSVTAGSVLLKLGTSMYAAARNRANTEYAMQQHLADRQLRDLQTQKLQGELNAPTYTYTTPKGANLTGLTAAQRATIEHEFNPVSTDESVRGPTPQDISDAIKKHGGTPPVTMTAKDINASRTVFGLESPEALRADARRVATAAKGLRFDPRSEAEITSERTAQENAANARRAAAGELLSGRGPTGSALMDAKGQAYHVSSTELLNPNDSPYVLQHPAVVKADAQYQATRARNVTLALGRAKNFDDLVSGLSLFQKDDPLLSDPGLASVAHASLAAARKFATTPAQKSQLDALVGGDVDRVLAGAGK